MKSRQFRAALAQLRTLAPHMPSYDAALLLACVRAQLETLAAVSENLAQGGPPVSARTVAYHVSHRLLADELCRKHGLRYHAPDSVGIGHSELTLRLPNLARLPDIYTLTQHDYKT